jgi:hypothetical protein
LKHLHFLSRLQIREIKAMFSCIQKIQLFTCVINTFKLICNCRARGYMDLVKEIESSRSEKELGQCGQMDKTINMMMEPEVSKGMECIHLPLCRLPSLENFWVSFLETRMLNLQSSSIKMMVVLLYLT